MGRCVSEAAKERNRERARKWRAENTERAKAAVRSYRSAHAEQARKRTRAWQRANPEKVREHSRLRHQRVKAAPIGDLTSEQWKAILQAHDYRCAYCGTRLKLGQDHIVPLALGGPHTAANVVPSCFPCNNRKALNDAPLPPPAPWVRVRAERG